MRRRTIKAMRPATPAGQLLLFKSVVAPQRRAVTALLLHDGLGGGWASHGDADLWELADATAAPEEQPVAVAATRALGDGRRVQLVGFVVSPGQRRRGIAQRLVEDLSGALRGRGVLTLATAVPSDHVTAMVVVQRAGLRPTHVQRASRDDVSGDLVWFDMEL